jgi:DNA-binding IclR family transcriptional regulator
LGTVLKALDIIEELATAGGTVSVKELAARVGRPVPTTHRLLRTLELRDYVENSGGAYRLTLKMFDIGSSIVASVDIVSEARPLCQALCNKVEETVNLAVRSGTSAVYVLKLDCARSLRLFTQLGLHVPLHATSLGKTLLAFENEPELSAVLEQLTFDRRTEHTITNRATFEEELEMIRRQGYAIDDEEFERGLICISAPIFNVEGHITAAVSISGPPIRLRPKIWEQLGAEVRKTADEISAVIGHRNSWPEGSSLS